MLETTFSARKRSGARATAAGACSVNGAHVVVEEGRSQVATHPSHPPPASLPVHAVHFRWQHDGL